MQAIVVYPDSEYRSIHRGKGWHKYNYQLYGICQRCLAYQSHTKGIEVDFYVPDASTAIQVCFDLDNSAGTFDREVKALLKITEVLECRLMLIITRDTERMLEISGKKIEVLPVWKWLLNL